MKKVLVHKIFGIHVAYTFTSDQDYLIL